MMKQLIQQLVDYYTYYALSYDFGLLWIGLGGSVKTI